jgi:hypothetical protein
VLAVPGIGRGRWVANPADDRNLDGMIEPLQKFVSERKPEKTATTPGIAVS